MPLRLAAPDLHPVSGAAPQTCNMSRMRLASAHAPQADRTAARRRATLRRGHAPFFAEENPIKRNEIAGRQMSVLRRYQGPRGKPLRIPDIKEMFLQMRDQA